MEAARVVRGRYGVWWKARESMLGGGEAKPAGTENHAAQAKQLLDSHVMTVMKGAILGGVHASAYRKREYCRPCPSPRCMQS